MNYLLDTHTFLWFITADSKLSSRATAAIRSPISTVYLSVASVWEATVKYQSGKLPLPESPQKFMTRYRELHQIRSLPIDEGTISHLPSLPAVHRDPFDRILVCQALQHNLTLVTADALLSQYPVPILS